MRVALLIIGLLSLSACHSAHYQGGPVSVKQNPAKTVIHTPGGSVEYHCPPGQRKKGNC